MATFSKIRDCRFANADSTAIDCIVVFDELGELPFTATANDSEEHGRAIWAAIRAGKAGNIAPYQRPVAPPQRQPTKAELMAQLQALQAKIAALSE